MAATQHEVRSDDGTRIQFWLSGHGRPLLIIPGTATDPRMFWDGVRGQLDPHVSVAVMERRAICGDPLGELDMAREFEDVAAVAASLGEDVSVLGHSSGALCAMGASLIMRARRLLLFEPPFYAAEAHYRPALDRMWALLRADDIDGLYDTWLKQYVGIPEEPAEALKVSAVGAAMRPLAQYLPREMSSHFARAWRLEDFAGIHAPTIYITGSVTAGNAELRGWLSPLQSVMPDFCVREIAGQDHFAPVLAPAEFAAFLLGCLEQDFERAGDVE